MDDFFKEQQCTVLFDASKCEPPHCSCGGTEMVNVIVEASKDFSRKPCSDPDIDIMVEQEWTRRLKENNRLYNADKLRLNSVHRQNGDIILEVALTNYKEYIGTNMNDTWKPLFSYGRTNYGNEHACMSDALGVSTVLVTADNYILFVRRSHEVAEAQGLIDVPGGHAEPLVSKLTKPTQQISETIYQLWS